MTVVARPQTHKSFIDLEQNELRNATLQNLGADIGSPIDGLIFYRSDLDRARLRANSAWVSLATLDDIAGSGIPATIVDVKGDLIVATAADTVARLAAGANGTMLFADSTETTGLEWRVAAPGDITFAATDRLLGRDTAGAGVGEELTVTGGLEFTGSGGIQRSALTGNVTAPAGSNTTTIAAGVVTLAMHANMATDRLLGRDTAGSGVPEELTVGGGIEFTGSGGIQRSALTGDVTASAGSGTTAIAAGVIVDADVNASAAIAATKLAFTPAQGIAATNVQAAIEEAVTDLTTLIGATVQAQVWKDPVDAATTGVLPNTPTYSSGAGTLTASSNAAFPTIDTTVTAVAGQDYLVKDQASSFQNGIYTLTTLGSGAAAWVLTRRADASTATELQDAATAVEAGTANGGDIWTQTNQTLADLTAATQTWTKTGDLNTVYTADGTTITLTGSQFSVTTAGITATQLAASVAGNGLAGGAGTALSVNVDAQNMAITSDTVHISTGAAGAGLIGGGANVALAVGAGTGITVNANDVAVDTTTVTRKYAVAIGDGAATSFTVTHSLGTRAVQVTVYLDSGTYEEIEVEIQHTTTNTVTVVFTGLVPTASQYQVVVQG